MLSINLGWDLNTHSLDYQASAIPLHYEGRPRFLHEFDLPPIIIISNYFWLWLDLPFIHEINVDTYMYLYRNNLLQPAAFLTHFLV